jgi:hypothetical protein
MVFRIQPKLDDELLKSRVERDGREAGPKEIVLPESIPEAQPQGDATSGVPARQGDESK